MTAFAACPTAFGTTCAVGGTDVCTTTGTTFTCDVSGSDDSAECTVVSDYDATSDLEAWGFVRVSDGMGGYTQEEFCCESSQQVTPTAVYIEGSAYADLLQFTWDSLANNLDGVGAAITGTINGYAGNDIINGSHASGANIAETLNGGVDNDTIRGNDDVDTLNGGDDDDVLMGGAGNDTMNGDGGSDEMLGGVGADTMNGGAGRDFMSGGADNDIMDGGSGGDIMCGDGEGLTGGDILDDGDATDEGAGLTDELWSAIAADEAYCNDASTKWDGNAAGTCGSNPTISSPPTACP